MLKKYVSIISLFIQSQRFPRIAFPTALPSHQRI